MNINGAQFLIYSPVLIPDKSIIQNNLQVVYRAYKSLIVRYIYYLGSLLENILQGTCDVSKLNNKEQL